MSLRWTRQVKMANIRVEKWSRMVHYWEVMYYLPGDPARHKVAGITFTLRGARRRVLAALGGTLKRGSYVLEPKEANE